MDYEAGSYRRLVVKQYPARSLRETAEGKYWKRFAAPSVAKQVGYDVISSYRTPRAGSGSNPAGSGERRQQRRRPPHSALAAPAAPAFTHAPTYAPSSQTQIGGVSHIDFCPQQPYNYAITASTRVSVHGSFCSSRWRAQQHQQQ
jgi:hypothetical protein